MQFSIEDKNHIKSEARCSMRDAGRRNDCLIMVFKRQEWDDEPVEEEWIRDGCTHWNP